MHQSIETVFVKVSINSRDFVIGCIYRPPKSDCNLFYSKIEDLLYCVARNHGGSTLILHGDFNLDLLQNNIRSTFLPVMLGNNLYPLILRPTRVQGQSATLIDNIFCNNLNLLSGSGIYTTDISDHFAIYCSFLPQNNEASDGNFVEVRRRELKPANINLLKESISDFEWHEIKSLDSANEIYNKFSDTVNEIYDRCCPLRTYKIKMLDRDKPYITSDIKALIKEKHRLQKKFNKFPITYGTEYRNLRNKLSILIRSAKSAYFKNKINNNDTSGKETWKTVNSLLGRNKKDIIPNKFLIENVWIDDPLIIANKFNEHFSSLGENLSSQFPESSQFQNYLQRRVDCVFSFDEVTSDEVRSVVLSLRNASPGIDNIPMSLFSDNIVALADIIAFVCNKSFEQGVFPERLAVAIIICLFKKGNINVVENYRAISLLVAFSKILEKLVSIRLINYFLVNNLFTEAQFGFLPGRSTEDAVHNIVDNLYRAFDAGECAIGTFLDLSKAFDSLDRRILCAKLKHYGIRGTALQWFESYLGLRAQHVRFKGVLSRKLYCNVGVPQGGIISTILFIIYINDLVHCSNDVKFILYADDSNIFVSDVSIENCVTNMNNGLNAIKLWMCCNRLTLNVDKSCYMLFKRRGHVDGHIGVKIDNLDLNRVDSVKFLGVALDERLSWCVHAANIAGRISKFVPILYNVRSNLDLKSMKIIYYALIYPNIIYCNSVWGNCCAIYLSPLELVLKKIVRVMTFGSRYEHTPPLFQNLSLLNIKNVNKYMSLLFVFKCLSKNNELFIPHHIDMYNTRSNNTSMIQIPNIISSHSRQGIRWSGVELWNWLPGEVKSPASYSTFKFKLKQHLLEVQAGAS